ncbi:hypothetical protein [Novosphingopyxis baekryungensis]|uniref:hypothetical protein n=1 Tax=Novosphingopyxis baekryungensis TaxID=279369 RepID=UPI0012EC5AFD|nr:hypothetical protein [Novosphingopyxis baekryungensis]
MFLSLLFPIALLASMPAHAVQQSGTQTAEAPEQSQRAAAPEGMYRAIREDGSPQPVDDRPSIRLLADGSFALTLGGPYESETFSGTWHQEGDQIIFDSIVSKPPITLERASLESHKAQRPGQNNRSSAQPMTKILFKPKTGWLAEAMPSWEVWLQFEDGGTAEALVTPSTFAATAPRAGKLRGIRVKGTVGQGGGDVTVPIPPHAADAEIFTLAVHPIAIETTGTSETPPPLTIGDGGLFLDGSLLFVKETPR